MIYEMIYIRYNYVTIELFPGKTIIVVVAGTGSTGLDVPTAAIGAGFATVGVSAETISVEEMRLAVPRPLPGDVAVEERGPPEIRAEREVKPFVGR